jgi:hypothetical protein
MGVVILGRFMWIALPLPLPLLQLLLVRNLIRVVVVLVFVVACAINSHHGDVCEIRKCVMRNNAGGEIPNAYS